MKQRVEVVKKTAFVDSKGNVIKNQDTFEAIKTISTDIFIPYSSANTKKTYGFDINTTHRTFTYDKVKINDYLRFNNQIYHIVQLQQYPRMSVLLMELI